MQGVVMVGDRLAGWYLGANGAQPLESNLKGMCSQARTQRSTMTPRVLNLVLDKRARIVLASESL